MSSKLSVLRVGFFLDGYTLKKVNEYYLKYHRYHARLDFRALKGWVRDYAVRLLGREACPVEVEAHYYHPYVRSTDVAELSTGDGMDRFEKQLTLAGFEVHYNTPDHANKMGPNMQLVEDAYLYAYYHKIDVLVLLSTQGQYSTLPERLKREGVPMLLLGWNFMYEKDNTTVCWKTDSCLRELSGYYVAMEDVAEKYPPRHGVARNLFMLPYSARPSHSSPWRTYLKKLVDSIDDSHSGFEKASYEKSPALARLG
ncbi:NYN domain-containing protein [Fibrobacter sp. UWB11]|uniref:NYN domain-containing protein n=1 Tax=Fibrobacter sp. UWB11 TaxID=1896202 RepID=UPI000927293D|nr:NYN domain-containing protein [Fibrobacter sp. UWB11]SIO34720.1 NYN domain-containing protein [Fibrobacter sp. UWB11]